MVARAGTLLIPSGPSHDPDRKHLFIVCTDPCEEGKQLLVGVTTWVNDQCDDACILEPHEHEFLNRKSFILYRAARIEEATTLDNGVREGKFQLRAAMNAQTFLRVKNGVCRSKQTPRKIKKYAGCPADPPAAQ